MLNIIVSLALFGLVKTAALTVCARKQMYVKASRLAFDFIFSTAAWFLSRARLPLPLLTQNHDGLHAEGELRSGMSGSLVDVLEPIAPKSRATFISD